MRVVLSNLAARYHEKDGWERKVLAGYVEHKPRGGDGLVANDFDRPGTTYYILEVGANCRWVCSRKAPICYGQVAVRICNNPPRSSSG